MGIASSPDHMQLDPSEGGVVLVTMPFVEITGPSIQLGILKAFLDREGIPCQTRSYNVALFHHLSSMPCPPELELTVERYDALADQTRFASEWVFHPWVFDRAPTPETDAAFFEYIATIDAPATLVNTLSFVRDQIPSFLSWCVDDILKARPRVVGFSSTFAQNLGSLALSKSLKARDPSLKIVFGGSNCDGPMGAALHRSFPWIDVVVRGEAEPVLLPLVRDLLAGREVASLPGLCVRRGGESVVIPQVASQYAMDDVPTPDYDEYFARIAGISQLAEMRQEVRLRVESARGCWWGQKMHCTFCGLNGSSMKFRSKRPELALGDLLTLARSHQVLKFSAVDNIIDLKYLKSMLPLLRETGLDLQLFYETKSNLKKDELEMMQQAGVTSIQPGIESLSTPILALMKKGVTALQNIRLLKWCAELGIDPAWNLLYGFPGEPIQEYERMTKLVPLLVHLPSPTLVRLSVQRFSPYHEHPEAYGIDVRGPAVWYKHLYALDSSAIMDLAYIFEFSYGDQRDPDEYIKPLDDAVKTWSARRLRLSLGGPLLFYQVGPAFVQVTDRRQQGSVRQWVLEGPQADIFLACDAGATVETVARTVVDDDLTIDDIREFMDELVEKGIFYREDTRYLSLPIHLDFARTSASKRRSSKNVDDQPPLEFPRLVQLRKKN